MRIRNLYLLLIAVGVLSSCRYYLFHPVLQNVELEKDPEENNTAYQIGDTFVYHYTLVRRDTLRKVRFHGYYFSHRRWGKKQYRPYNEYPIVTDSLTGYFDKIELIPVSKSFKRKSKGMSQIKTRYFDETGFLVYERIDAYVENETQTLLPKPLHFGFRSMILWAYPFVDLDMNPGDVLYDSLYSKRKWKGLYRAQKIKRIPYNRPTYFSKYKRLQDTSIVFREELVNCVRFEATVSDPPIRDLDNKLVSYYNTKYGFIRLEYSNIVNHLVFELE